MTHHRGCSMLRCLLAVLVLSAVYLLGTKHLLSFRGQVKGLSESKQLFQQTVHRATETSLPNTTMVTAASQLAQSKVADPKVKLILLTYMRSGSTFTGDLFNHHPQVFYFYEPLWSFDFHFKKGQPIYFFNDHRVLFNSSAPEQLSSLQKNTIKSVLSCEFWQINTQVYKTLMYPWAALKSESVNPFVKCMKASRSSSIAEIMDCVPVLDTECTSARVTLAKTVRFAMEQAETLLKNDPKVKVIHLVRDPRGVLRSREVTKIGLKYHVTGEQLCTKVLRDLQVSERLKKKYPGRILTARYEDLAEKPLDFSQRLLTFAGLEMTSSLQQYVWRITSSGNHVNEQAAGTFRSDSRNTASHWRNSSTFDFVASIDRYCSEVYKLMGYIPFANERELKDLGRPVYRNLSEKLSRLWTV